MTVVSLQNLTLVTNKKLTNLQDAVIRQSEKGLTITAVFLNEDSSPYDLTNKKVIFNEHKESDKYVVDTNVQITDARNGAISYTLHSQCYAATGEAWFEIADASGTVVDSTQNFNLKVKDAANASIYNTNYIAQLDALRDQMQQLVDGADGKLKQQLQTTQNQLNQKLTDIGNAYQTAEQGRANAYKQAEANRDSGWSQDKQRIDNEWNQDKDRINGEWNSQKQSIQNTANSQQSSISSQWSQLKSNADSQLATIQKNINALQATIDDIDKNKVPGFNSSLQSAQDKFDKILSNLHGFVVSSNDVDKAVSKGIADITGNLIDPNLNDWVKNDVASKANININYQDGTNDITFTGVENSEVLDLKFNTKQNTDYILTFTYTPDDIHTIRSNCLFLALWYEDLTRYYGQWSTDYNPKTNAQVIRVPAQQGGNYSLKVNSQNLTEMHIGISFDNFTNGQTSKFKISNLVVRETNSTLVGLTDTISSLQSKYFQVQDLPANTNVDNFSQTGLYNLRGQAGITGLPQGGNLWGTLLVFNNNNGSNGIQMYLNSNDDYFFYREWNKSSGFVVRRPWKRLASMTDVQPLWDKLNLSGNLSRMLKSDSTWADIFGNNDTTYGHIVAFKADIGNHLPNIIGDNASGIAFGNGDTRGALSVEYAKHHARIIGGNGNSPVWGEDIAWKSDFANYYNKSETDSKVSYLQGQIDTKAKNLFLNILDYGAKAEDSNFDNAPAFNKAIQSLPSTGGIIYIPNGNFFLKSTVTIDRSYVHIMGLNHGLRSGIDPSDGTTQTGGGGAKVTVQNSISAFKIQNTHNDKRLSGITFSGFDLKGDTNGGVGIDGVSNTDRVVIDNMTINNIGTGVKLNGADAPRITNSWIAETESSIQLTGASQQAEIKSNSLGAQPQGITILLENADRYNISGNNIYPDGSSAIRLLNPVHGAIVGNTISAYYTGIIEMLPNGTNYGNSNVISGNVISIESWENNPIGRDNKWGIIHIEGYDNLISGNNILANGSPQDTTGILIMKGDRNKIATNIINIQNTTSKVVCNGSANNNTVVYSTDSSSFQNGLNSSNQNIDFDEVNALKENCSVLETQLNVLQGQMSSLLSAITVSGQDVTINGTISIEGQIKNYWGGTDQYVAYAPNGTLRGYFGFYDGGNFVTEKG